MDFPIENANKCTNLAEEGKPTISEEVKTNETRPAEMLTTEIGQVIHFGSFLKEFQSEKNSAQISSFSIENDESCFI